jgi:hypothetical protein
VRPFNWRRVAAGGPSLLFLLFVLVDRREGLSGALEILDRAFVLLGSGARGEGAEIALLS